jgi:hypothetical protein
LADPLGQAGGWYASDALARANPGRKIFSIFVLTRYPLSITVSLVNRGIVTKRQAKMITLWVPIDLLPRLEQAVQIQDSDRSKFIRNAIRNQLAQMGLGERPQLGGIHDDTRKTDHG